MAMTRFEYEQWGARATAVRGDDLPHAKLSPEIVRAIRSNPDGLTARQHADLLGVHYRTVEKVRHFETWGHVV